MLANLEKSAVVTGLEKVNFHSKPEEGQCQRMFKLPQDCPHFICQQGNAQSPSNQASVYEVLHVYELRPSNCKTWIQKRQRNQRSHCQHPLDHRKSKVIAEKKICFIDYVKAFDCVDHNKLLKILKEMGIPECLTCLLRNLYAGQEVPVRTSHGTMN